MNSDFEQFYAEVAACTRDCPGITNDPANGVIPRSFYVESDPSLVEVLVVGKNPGQAPDWEKALYKTGKPEKLVGKHLKLVSDLFYRRSSVGTSFHSNLIKRVAGVLGVENRPESVLPLIALTTLVKCQSSGSSQAKLESVAIHQCAGSFLMREIGLYKPVYLLALGTEVFNYLKQPSLQQMHGLPVGKLYHPSWSNMRGGEENYFSTEIVRLRAEYLEAKNA